MGIYELSEESTPGGYPVYIKHNGKTAFPDHFLYRASTHLKWMVVDDKKVMEINKGYILTERGDAKLPTVPHLKWYHFSGAPCHGVIVAEVTCTAARHSAAVLFVMSVSISILFTPSQLSEAPGLANAAIRAAFERCHVVNGGGHDGGGGVRLASFTDHDHHNTLGELQRALTAFGDVCDDHQLVLACAMKVRDLDRILMALPKVEGVESSAQSLFTSCLLSCILYFLLSCLVLSFLVFFSLF